MAKVEGMTAEQLQELVGKGVRNVTEPGSAAVLAKVVNDELAIVVVGPLREVKCWVNAEIRAEA